MVNVKLVHRTLLSCEAIVRRCPNNELILICQCGDITEPAPLNRVFVWHSKDDGKTWSKPELIIPEDGRAIYQTEVSVIKDEIRCYLTAHDGKFCNYECFVVSSFDNGYTWNNTGKVNEIEGFVFIRGLLINKNGDHILPYQNYPISKEEDLVLHQNNKYIWDSKIEHSKTGTLVSKDGGKTYQKSNDVLFPLFINTQKRWVWSEPTVAYLSNNDLVMLMRVCKTGYLYKSISKDNGKTWSKPQKTDIPNPSNKAKLINMEDGRIALLNTPNSNLGMGSRTPLSLWISDDDMKTWSYKKDLVTFDGWCSYPDGFIENKTLYLSFEFNRHDVYFLKYKIE